MRSRILLVHAQPCPRLRKRLAAARAISHAPDESARRPHGSSDFVGGFEDGPDSSAIGAPQLPVTIKIHQRAKVGLVRHDGERQLDARAPNNSRRPIRRHEPQLELIKHPHVGYLELCPRLRQRVLDGDGEPGTVVPHSRLVFGVEFVVGVQKLAQDVFEDFHVGCTPVDRDPRFSLEAAGQNDRGGFGLDPTLIPPSAARSTSCLERGHHEPFAHRHPSGERGRDQFIPLGLGQTELNELRLPLVGGLRVAAGAAHSSARRHGSLDRTRPASAPATSWSSGRQNDAPASRTASGATPCTEDHQCKAFSLRVSVFEIQK